MFRKSELPSRVARGQVWRNVLTGSTYRILGVVGNRVWLRDVGTGRRVDRMWRREFDGMDMDGSHRPIADA